MPRTSDVRAAFVRENCVTQGPPRITLLGMSLPCDEAKQLCLRVLPALALLAVGPSAASADTIVPGGSLPAGLTVWSLAGSPYELGGDVTVPQGATLVIEPGVEVSAAEVDSLRTGSDSLRVELLVHGRLRAIGTRSAPVFFHGNKIAKASWGGLRFYRSSSPEIEHVIVQGATMAIRSETDIAAAHLALEHNEAGVRLINCVATLESVIAVNNDTGLSTDRATISLRNALIVGEQTGIFFDGCHRNHNDVLLDHVTVAGHEQGGVTGSGSGCELDIRNSIFVDNPGGGVPAGYFRRFSTRPSTAMNTVTWNNGPRDGVPSGVGNFSADPRFRGPNDYRLRADSPCIDAAASDLSNDANGAPRPIDGDEDGTALPDIGAFEYVPPVCGDGIAEAPEFCDLGEENGEYASGCSEGCDGPGEFCGDGLLNGPEQYDDGNTSSGDGCNHNCKIELPDAGTASDAGSLLDAAVAESDAGGAERDASLGPQDASTAPALRDAATATPDASLPETNPGGCCCNVDQDSSIPAAPVMFAFGLGMLVMQRRRRP